MEIFCCECKTTVVAQLTDGADVYPHRPDLKDIPFWQCDECRNFVGTHYKHHRESKRLNPLGCIASKEILAARKKIHALLDPLWKNNYIKRKRLYSIISERIGKEYHTAEIKSIEEARSIWRIISGLHEEIMIQRVPYYLPH